METIESSLSGGLPKNFGMVQSVSPESLKVLIQEYENVSYILYD